MNDIPSFDQAVERFRQFLRENGLNGNVLWVFREDLSVRGTGQAWVRLPLPERNAALARASYEKGRTDRIGVVLSVYCVLNGDACCYVWVPKDEVDAEYALLSGLKLRLPQPVRHGRALTTPSLSAIWHWLGRPRPDPWLDEVPAATEFIA